MLPRRRGFQAGNVQEKTRTHMLFSTAADRTIAKRKRRPHNKFHQMQQHKRDELVQTGPDELDPSQWTGNQRVIHFGPMAQRDPFFYFYPKGWDLLYPAQFGFFPYRTNKFRGNSAVICVWAFGIFLLLGGALMIYLGYFLVYKRPFWRWTEAELAQLIPPIQIAGPILAVLGILLILLAIGCTISTSQFLSDKLRHHHHRDQPASVTVYTTHYQQPRAIYEVNPYQPMAPPAHTVLENPYARTNLLEPSKEMKLFPPVMPGYSTLSLHGQQSPSFVASPYNTLRALSMHSSPSAADIREPSTQSQPAPALHHHHQSSHGHHHSHSHHHRHRHSHSTHHHHSPTKRKRTSSSEFLMNGDGPSNNSASPMDSTLPGQSEINANSNGIGEGTAGDLMEPSDVVQNPRQFSSINVNTVEYSIPTELQYIDYLGGGNYGNVIKVRSLVDGQVLAVKKMYEPFSHEVKARRVYREMKLLELINHENIIRFADIYTPDRDFRSFKNVYIVSGYAGISLKQVLDRQKQLGIRLLNQDHIKYLIYQLLRALKYLHSANVIHRDLKPSNLAITEECDLTVLDFGLARTVSANTDNLTAYVISRWYRSPEVIYWNNVSYNAKADVWSVGCILGELLTDKVLFPGSEAMEQYKLIIRLCGSPDEELMNKIEQQNSPAMRMVIERMSGFCERRNFRRIFHQSPPDAVDLLDRLLVLDPDRRISVEEALQHAYMRDYHLPEDEPVAAHPFNIEDNDTTKTLADWREAVWHELQLHESKRCSAAIAAQNNANSNNQTTLQQPSLDQSTMQSSLPATTDQLPSSSKSTEMSNQLVELEQQKAEASATDGICANLAQEDGNLTTPQHFPTTSSTPNQSQMSSSPIVSSSSPSPKRSTEVPRSHCSSI